MQNPVIMIVGVEIPALLNGLSTVKLMKLKLIKCCTLLFFGNNLIRFSSSVTTSTKLHGKRIQWIQTKIVEIDFLVTFSRSRSNVPVAKMTSENPP